MDARNSNQEFVISRVFDAPRDLVWRAFTEQEHMQNWWGPKGITIGNAKLDLRPGGTFHYSMHLPDGSVWWGKFVYREITPQSRIVFTSSFSDEHGGVTRNPMNPSWPLQMLSVITLDDMGGKTKFTAHWSALDASESEQATFVAGFPSMKQGWGGTLDKFAAYLATQA